MSDSYQAIYDAARSRIGSADTGSIIRSVVESAFDISWQKGHLQQAIFDVAASMQRPCVLFRPSLSIDGNQWCALYGENLQDGCAGFGATAALAMDDFDRNWVNQQIAGAKS